jgi:hypothetical protein
VASKYKNPTFSTFLCEMSDWTKLLTKSEWRGGKGPSTLAFFASVSPSAMALPPNIFLCAIMYVIAREKQRKQLGSGAITDGETDAKNASVDGP